MANLGNLIVRGVTRILGDAYANKFIGNLQGNADTATSAIKASTADSATNATSANKASIATAVQDYGTSSYKEIKIGYSGSGLSSSTIETAVGFTDNGTKIKDISKNEFRNWLATASGTWPITVSNSSNSANAEYANYLNITYGSELRFGNISSSQTDLWFNYANPDGTQNNVSKYYFGDGKNGTNSTIIAAQFTGNAASASTIATEQETSNVYRNVFFAYNGDKTKVVYDDDFMYNPSTNTLKIGTGTLTASNYSGTATNANNLANIPAGNYFKHWDAVFNSEWSGKYLWTLWDNHLYAADKRLAVTLTGTTSTNFSSLFDGSFESSVSITEAKAVLHIKSTTEGNVWTEGLPYGDFYVVFYNSDAENITGRVYCNYAPQGTGWHDLDITHVGSYIWKLHNGYYQLSDLEITITKPVSSASIDLCQVLHVVERSPSPYYAAVMSKYCDQKTNYSIESTKFVKTGGTSSQFLKADGSIDSNTYSKSNHTHSSVLDINDSNATTFAYSKSELNYGDYTWLAGWNGYELRAVNKSQFAQASHTHTKSQITDFPTSLPANGGYANEIASKDMLDSQEKIDNFITPNRFEYALFKTNDANNVDFASNDGMILSIPWASTTYGFQMAFDDTLIGNIKVRGKSNTWGNWYTLLHSGNYTSYTVKKDGTGASGTWGIDITGNAATTTNASAVNGVSLTWDGEINSSQWIAAWESGTSIKPMSAYNTFISMCSYLDEGSSDVTDGTMFITSYATDNGFADPNGKNKPYKRKASLLWNYINNKCSNIYATTAWVNDNYYTCSESDSRYIQSETDPVWTAAKGNYYTKTECDNRYQPKGTYLTEQNLQGYATQEWVRGEEYLYRSGGTMDARAEIGITTKLFIGNSTSPDTCYTKFNCILHGGGDESNPNWIIRDNGYSEFKSSVSANAFYASSDIRLKNILDDINIDFDKLKLIPKKYYTWKGSDILQLGTIAQDIQKIYPEVVSKNENGYLSVDYSKLSIIALAAIDKLNERIKELECQIKS